MIETYDRLVDQKGAAEILSMSVGFLEHDRLRGISIPFIRIGNGTGAIRYSTKDLYDYIESRRVAGPEITAA